MLQKLLLLALAGALGTLARYGLSGLVHRVAGEQFPWGTLAVNAVGCLAAGLFWAFAANRATITPETRTIVLIGFMGAFTTFSAFILETGGLARDSQWMAAFGNIALQNGVGLAMFVAGTAAGRLI